MDTPKEEPCNITRFPSKAGSYSLLVDSKGKVYFEHNSKVIEFENKDYFFAYAKQVEDAVKGLLGE